MYINLIALKNVKFEGIPKSKYLIINFIDSALATSKQKVSVEDIEKSIGTSFTGQFNQYSKLIDSYYYPEYLIALTVTKSKPLHDLVDLNYFNKNTEEVYYHCKDLETLTVSSNLDVRQVFEDDPSIEIYTNLIDTLKIRDEKVWYHDEPKYITWVCVPKLSESVISDLHFFNNENLGNLVTKNKTTGYNDFYYEDFIYHVIVGNVNISEYTSVDKFPKVVYVIYEVQSGILHKIEREDSKVIKTKLEITDPAKVLLDCPIHVSEIYEYIYK